MNGHIYYIEFALSQVFETIQFYEKLFKWSFEESFISNQQYYMFKTPDGQFHGGFDSMIEPSIKGPNIYIEVDSIIDILDKIDQYPNAKIIKSKTKISDLYGYYALIIDPSGNKIGLQESHTS